MNFSMQTHRHHRLAVLGGLFAVGVMSTGSIATTHTVVAPQLQRTTKYYELRAPNLVELTAEFYSAAGKGAVPVGYGLTKWDVTLNTNPSFGTRTSCAPERVTLRVAITTTLPKAVRSAQFSAEDAAGCPVSSSAVSPTSSDASNAPARPSTSSRSTVQSTAPC